MNDPRNPGIQDLLPELFGPSDKPFKPGGMCTPGSGCAPDPRSATTDLLKMLNGSISAPPAPMEDAGNPNEPPNETGSSAPRDEKEVLRK